MKKVFLIFFIVVCIFARENPFLPTPEFEEEKNRLLEKFINKQNTNILQNTQNIYVDNSLNDKIQEEIKIDNTTPIKSVSSEKAPLPKLEEQKAEPKKEHLPIATNKIEEKAIIKQEEKPKQVTVVKPTAKASETLSIVKLEGEQEQPKSIKTGLKFVKIVQYNDRIEIVSDYKVFKKLNIEKENKIVFDYRSNLDFTTKRLDLNHPYFKQVAIGNHKKDNYFRVVVELKEPISKFESTYNDTKVTIKYK